MVLVNADVTFQGYEQKQITRGEKAGQSFYIVKVLSGFDTLEIMIFDNDAELLSKILKANAFDKFTCTLGITQNSGNTRLSLIDLLPIKK